MYLLEDILNEAYGETNSMRKAGYMAPENLNANQGRFEAAFKNMDTGDVKITGAFHDWDQIPKSWLRDDGIRHFEDGFIETKTGRFFTRFEVEDYLDKEEETALHEENNSGSDIPNSGASAYGFDQPWDNENVEEEVTGNYHCKECGNLCNAIKFQNGDPLMSVCCNAGVKSFVSEASNKKLFILKKYRDKIWAIRDELAQAAEKAIQEWNKNPTEPGGCGNVAQALVKCLEINHFKAKHISHYSHDWAAVKTPVGNLAVDIDWRLYELSPTNQKPRKRRFPISGNDIIIARFDGNYSPDFTTKDYWNPSFVTYQNKIIRGKQF